MHAVAPLRALLRLHLDAFVRGPLPTLFVVGVVCGIVFSKNGLDPHLVPRLLASGSWTRAAAVGMAIVLGRGTSRAMLLPPGAAYLRASPVPRALQLAASGLLALAVQLPWLLAFAAGGAPLEGLGLACALVAACIASTSIELVLAVSLAIFAAKGAPLLLLLVLPRSHRAAPVWASSTLRVRVRASWWAQLAVAQLRTLYRAGATRIALALLWPAFGLFLVSVADERSERAVWLAAFVAALGMGPLVSPVMRTHRAITPFVRASTRWRRGPWLIALSILATPSMAFAAGTAHVAQGTPLVTGLAVVAVLATANLHLVPRRKDAGLLSVLLALPVIAVFTWMARSIAFAAIALLAALLITEPEVVRADDR